MYQVDHGISDLDMSAVVDALYHKYTSFVYIFSLFSEGKEQADPARRSQIIFIGFLIFFLLTKSGIRGNILNVPRSGTGDAPLAQLVEQQTLNLFVQGSNP